jgi:cytosine/adenosine deaminase-related metal-dependent hydrolase
MIREMKLASLISKIVEREASVASSMDLFNSATLRGAKALKRPDLGKIAQGAKADIVMMNLNTFNMCPVVDPISHLIHVSTNSDVDTVIVEGKTVVEKGKVIDFDEAKIFRKIQRSMDRIRERVPENDRRHRTAQEINPPSLKKWK